MSAHSLCADLQDTTLLRLFPVRYKASGRQASSYIGHGFVELDFPLLRSDLVSTARGYVFSNGLEAKFVDLHCTTHSCSDPVLPLYVDRPVCPG